MIVRCIILCDWIMEDTETLFIQQSVAKATRKYRRLYFPCVDTRNIITEMVKLIIRTDHICDLTCCRCPLGTSSFALKNVPLPQLVLATRPQFSLFLAWVLLEAQGEQLVYFFGYTSVPKYPLLFQGAGKRIWLYPQISDIPIHSWQSRNNVEVI